MMKRGLISLPFFLETVLTLGFIIIAGIAVYNILGIGDPDILTYNLERIEQAFDIEDNEIGSTTLVLHEDMLIAFYDKGVVPRPESGACRGKACVCACADMTIRTSENPDVLSCKRLACTGLPKDVETIVAPASTGQVTIQQKGNGVTFSSNRENVPLYISLQASKAYVCANPECNSQSVEVSTIGISTNLEEILTRFLNYESPDPEKIMKDYILAGPHTTGWINKPAETFLPCELERLELSNTDGQTFLWEFHAVYSNLEIGSLPNTQLRALDEIRPISLAGEKSREVYSAPKDQECEEQKSTIAKKYLGKNNGKNIYAVLQTCTVDPRTTLGVNMPKCTNKKEIVENFGRGHDPPKQLPLNTPTGESYQELKTKYGEPSFNKDNKDLRVTHYYTACESDRKDWNTFANDVRLQGSGKTIDGRMCNYKVVKCGPGDWGKKTCASKEEVINTCPKVSQNAPYGAGAYRAIQPKISIAGHPEDRGKTVYMYFTENSEWNGCYRVDDTGGLNYFRWEGNQFETPWKSNSLNHPYKKLDLFVGECKIALTSTNSLQSFPQIWVTNCDPNT